MRKIIIFTIAIIMSLTFSGCMERLTPSVAATVAQLYATTHTIQQKGEEIVIINADLLSEDTLKYLNKIDEKAKKIDKTKEILTSSNEEKYKLFKAEYDKLQLYFDNNIIGIEDSDMILRHEELSEWLYNYDRLRMTTDVLIK